MTSTRGSAASSGTGRRHEHPKDLPALTQTAQQRAAQQPTRPCDQNARWFHRCGWRECMRLGLVCLADALLHPKDRASALVSGYRWSVAVGERLVELADRCVNAGVRLELP